MRGRRLTRVVLALTAMTGLALVVSAPVWAINPGDDAAAVSEHDQNNVKPGDKNDEKDKGKDDKGKDDKGKKDDKGESKDRDKDKDKDKDKSKDRDKDKDKDKDKSKDRDKDKTKTETKTKTKTKTATETVAPTKKPDSLPVTGPSTSLIAAAGGFLVLAGAVLLARFRRRHEEG